MFENIIDYHNSARESLKDEFPLRVPEICKEEIHKLNYQILKLESENKPRMAKQLKEQRAKWELYERRITKLLNK